jgi:quinol monooxygenase YgiN
MSDSVFFVVELEVKPGQIDQLQSVMEEMAAVTQADEPGTLNYEWFLTDDGSACYIFERYANPDAAVVHSRTFPPELSRRAMAFLPTRLTAYGKLTGAIRRQRIDPLLAAVPGISLVVVEPLGGFAREAVTAQTGR